MRSSFGGSYGMGSGGARSGGGNMLKAVGRVVRTGVNGSTTNPVTRPTTTTTTTKTTTTKSKQALSLSSLSSSISGNLPVPSTTSWAPQSLADEFDWEYVNDDDVEIERASGFYYYDDYMFGAVPSAHEVQRAVFSLQEVLDPLSCSAFSEYRVVSDMDEDVTDTMTGDTSVMQRVPSGSNLDWIEPSMQLCSQRLSEHPSWDRVYDALHLLQSEPSVQRMVVSLSSDKAVWDAILNNEVVRELRKSYHKAAETTSQSSSEDSEPPSGEPSVLEWVLVNIRAKLMEVVGAITSIVSELFQPFEQDKEEQTADTFTEKLKPTLLLTVVVLLIVIVTRANEG